LGSLYSPVRLGDFLRPFGLRDVFQAQAMESKEELTPKEELSVFSTIYSRIVNIFFILKLSYRYFSLQKVSLDVDAFFLSSDQTLTHREITDYFNVGMAN
jgi:hypothetical protein